MTRATTITLFGSLCRYTQFTLDCLIRHNLAPVCVILSGYGPDNSERQSSDRTLLKPQAHPLIKLCENHRIDIYYVANNTQRLKQFLKRTQTDYFLLSCYPQKLPTEICSLARHCLNIHPSKLPAFKGPDPIFWQLLAGETQTGVSVHKVTEVIDAGDVLLFEPIAFPEGARLHELHSLLLEAAVTKFSELLQSPDSDWEFQPQNPHTTSWQNAPLENDLTIPRNVTARIAFNLARAYACTDSPLKVTASSRTYQIRDAIKWQPHPDSNHLGNENDQQVWVSFMDGSVLFLME